MYWSFFLHKMRNLSPALGDQYLRRCAREKFGEQPYGHLSSQIEVSAVGLSEINISSRCARKKFGEWPKKGNEEDAGEADKCGKAQKCRKPGVGIKKEKE